jgi:hypothetical protein
LRGSGAFEKLFHDFEVLSGVLPPTHPPWMRPGPSAFDEPATDGDRRLLQTVVSDCGVVSACGLLVNAERRYNRTGVEFVGRKGDQQCSTAPLVQ